MVVVRSPHYRFTHQSKIVEFQLFIAFPDLVSLRFFEGLGINHVNPLVVKQVDLLLNRKQPSVENDASLDLGQHTHHLDHRGSPEGVAHKNRLRGKVYIQDFLNVVNNFDHILHSLLEMFVSS